MGSLLSGYAWQYWGATDTFYAAALLAGLSWVLALLYVREDAHVARA